jgi:hypothetical protein
MLMNLAQHSCKLPSPIKKNKGEGGGGCRVQDSLDSRWSGHEGGSDFRASERRGAHGKVWMALPVAVLPVPGITGPGVAYKGQLLTHVQLPG